jgi:hypothetical protein
MTVGILDTSILLELLQVPGRFSQAAQIDRELVQRHNEGHSLLLPLAAILETGNHIARVSDGNLRRRAAERFVGLIRLAIAGQAPFTPIDDVGTEQVAAWCEHFVAWATPAAQSLTDLSIKLVWEQQCELYPAREVYVWTLDSDLSGCRRGPLL